MKYAIVIPDGAADEPLDDLDGKTPLAVAQTPNMDWIAANGKCGTVCNVPNRLPAGSDVAILSVIGYDPRESYTGRAPLEAAAKGIRIGPDETIFRCNLVTIVDGVMEDHSAGSISSDEARSLIEDLARHLNRQDIRFHCGVSYRHLMTLRGEGGAKTTPPHDLLGRRVGSHMPTGRGAKLLREIIQASQAFFAGHEINTVRADLGENAASSIWLWGQGKMPTFERFEDRFGLKVAAVTAVDLIRGIAKLIGWDVIEVRGATGDVDTNYAGKGAAAVAALDDLDMVFVHVEAPDEAGHNGDVAGKVRAIEQIDRHVVGPVLERLKAEGDQWRMLVLPDHPTPCSVRTHTRQPVPFAVAGKGIETIRDDAQFDELSAAAGDLHIALGHELMEFFLTVR